MEKSNSQSYWKILTTLIQLIEPSTEKISDDIEDFKKISYTYTMVYLEKIRKLCLTTNFKDSMSYTFSEHCAAVQLC